MIVLQFIDLLQKSELEKVYFCACGMSFCKIFQKPKNAKKSDSAVHIWMPFTKIDATGTFVDFFEFWFFLCARNLEFFYHLKNFDASQKLNSGEGFEWVAIFIHVMVILELCLAALLKRDLSTSHLDMWKKIHEHFNLRHKIYNLSAILSLCIKSFKNAISLKLIK